MLFCETCGSERKDFEDLAALVSQLDRAGAAPRIDVRSVPADLSRNAQFDIAPFLSDGPAGPEDRVVLVGADRLSDARLAELRRLAGPAPRTCLAFGRFETRQAVIGAKAKLSYVFGQDPIIFEGDAAAFDDGNGCSLPLFGVRCQGSPAELPRLLLVSPDLTDARQANALIALALSRRVRTAVLTDGRSKHKWLAAHGPALPCFHFGEVLPASLAERVDICVCFGPFERNYRLKCSLANLAVSGAVLIDGTRGHALAASNDAFVRGPIDLVGLSPFIATEILPNLAGLRDHVRSSTAAARSDPRPVLDFLGQPKRAPERVPAPGGDRSGTGIVFMPTNGVGLGHARRCALIARELHPTLGPATFAAFPSCARLIKANGFDVMPLVGRSSHHAQTHENDLANYIRLRALTAGRRALVFDGGYVFDSVYRTILQNRLAGVWIRRGLWQTGQDNSVALDREKAFARVIVPAEAFDELNVSYSQGDHLRHVGPIVERRALPRPRRDELRRQLAEKFGHEFDRLVVSLLGAGVAADRGAQTQALCGMMERRARVLHLVVVWPTTPVKPVWFSWRNTRIVRTVRAGVLTAAADLCVSAAGYNSFHEALYNKIPTIFVPQVGAFMDDQRARAAAALERGLGAMVEPHELMSLERETCRFLDEGKAETVRETIAGADLPACGNADAARLIEEMVHGSATLEHDPLADRPARRH